MPKKKERKEHGEELQDDIVFEDDISAEDGTTDYLQKIKKLKTELKVAREKEKEYLTGWQKAKADYANHKMREAQELADKRKRIERDILEEFLPVLDSFDMAMANKEAWEKADENWRIGVEFIRNQLWSVLQGHGLVEIIETGSTFDPNVHDPIEMVEVGNNEQKGVIVEVAQKGYKIGDTVLRPAKVRVGK